MKVTEFKKKFKSKGGKFVSRAKAKRVVYKGIEYDSMTEVRYLRSRLEGQFFFGRDCVIIYHPEPIYITRSGRKYTPDFVVVTKEFDPKKIYIEVKGAYKLQSEDRARLAFEIASEDNPQCFFVWVKEVRKGRKFVGWEEEWWKGGELWESR